MYALKGDMGIAFCCCVNKIFGLVTLKQYNTGCAAATNYHQVCRCSVATRPPLINRSSVCILKNSLIVNVTLLLYNNKKLTLSNLHFRQNIALCYSVLLCQQKIILSHNIEPTVVYESAF